MEVKFMKPSTVVSKETVSLVEFIKLHKINKIEVSSRNFASSNRVVLFLSRGNGDYLVVTCSASISEGLRNKSISLSQLGSMMVAEQANQQGEVYLSLQKPPSTSERFDLTGVLNSGTYVPEPVKIDWEEYVGL